MNNPVFSDFQLYNFLCDALALLVSGYLVVFAVGRLKRGRPDLAIGKAVAVAFLLRFAAAGALNQLSISWQLRGGDETTFFGRAGAVADTGLFSSESIDALTSKLHVFLLSVNDRLLDAAPHMIERIELIAIATVGLAFMATGVYELAGPRAAVIAAWILAVEPTHVFFSGIVHKEPLMFLSEGLLVYGGARMWKQGSLNAALPLVLGCLIAIATRPYVGWFFVAAAAAVSLHAALRRREGRRPLALLALGVMLFAIFVPIALSKSSDEKLTELQASQNANVTDENANLTLEKVDYSTRANVILNLPTRVRDVVLKPYPWQVQNTSQRLGLLGTTVLLVGLFLLFAAVLRNGSDIMRRAGPLVYPAVFALIAYALSAGNAGTAYRYRTHVVAMMLCVLVCLREHRLAESVEGAESEQRSRVHPLPTARAATR